MIYNQFYNLSCYEEFEIKCALMGISKLDVLKEICHQVNDYYFFVSNDGIFNWFDLEGNHVKDPGILKKLTVEHIPKTITKCIIPNSVTSIGDCTFWNYKSLKEVIIPDSVTSIGDSAFWFCESLEKIIIPDSVTYIGYWAFHNCKSLKKVIISNSLTYIKYATFSSCYSLNEVIFKGKTLDEVKHMENYPFGIEDESIIKCEI